MNTPVYRHIAYDYLHQPWCLTLVIYATKCKRSLRLFDRALLIYFIKKQLVKFEEFSDRRKNQQTNSILLLRVFCTT